MSPYTWGSSRKLTGSGLGLTINFFSGTMLKGVLFLSFSVLELTFDCSQDLNSFEGQPDVINHVAIVNPKPGIFVDEINHLLVLCTPLTVILLGVSAVDVPGPNRTTRKEIK